MQKIFGIIASFYGFSAVALGAFGAHALKTKLDEYHHAIYEKAVSYQFYHVAALLAVVFLSTKIETKSLNYAGWFFTAGTLFFSGSLYLLATTDLLGLQSLKNILGPITPLGGLCFLIGWVLLIISFSKL
ncbi:MAG: DUF423 domain-containing protein [Chitinophagales bacterium]